MAGIHWYGERGIVNGLILDIGDDLELLKRVLRAIEWCSPCDAEWIDEVSGVDVLVEPGFSEFGSPDLIFVLTGQGGRRHAVIVEAKAVVYKKSAKSNAKGMSQKAFNSSINGQLALDYRLALAIESYEPGQFGLQEPQWALDAYREHHQDPNEKPRRLLKPLAVRKLAGERLAGLKSADFRFVAMTTDERPNPIPCLPESLRPLLLRKPGEDASEPMTSQQGFLSIPHLRTDVLKSAAGNFAAACDNHIGSGRGLRDQLHAAKPATPVGAENRFDWPGLPSKPWTDYGTDWAARCQVLAEACADELREHGEGRLNKGSYSFISHGKTVAKLSPDPATLGQASPTLLVGLSAQFPEAEDLITRLGGETLPRKVVGEPFLFRPVELGRDDSLAVEVIRAFVQSVSDDMTGD